MNVPLMIPMIVRIVKPSTASMRIAGMRVTATSRRITAPYDHTSAASIAAGANVTRNT